MEAMWREALWLVADDVATASEIDDAVRLGAGLRWSFMGSFLTYRAAGGEAGMRHFLEQFGPTLEWPWTKLTDVPELSDDLIEKLVAQSDAQAAGRSARELEQLRDDCLVSVLQGLRANRYGAGAVLERHERQLFAAAGAAGTAALDTSGPLALHEATVLPEWVDYNGHAHESRYLQVFGDTTDALLAALGIDAAYLDGVGSYFTVETHLSHLREASAGDRLRTTTQVLGCDEKRLHIFHSLYRGDELVATAEQMMLHVSVATGRTGPAGDTVLARAREIAAAHAALPLPERAGRSIAMP
jgi:carnitine 3-dehydrogenase